MRASENVGDYVFLDVTDVVTKVPKHDFTVFRYVVVPLACLTCCFVPCSLNYCLHGINFCSPVSTYVGPQLLFACLNFCSPVSTNTTTNGDKGVLGILRAARLLR